MVLKPVRGHHHGTSLVAQMIKNLSAMQVQSLGQEDPLKKGKASSVLAWRSLWTEELGGL